MNNFSIPQVVDHQVILSPNDANFVLFVLEKVEQSMQKSLRDSRTTIKIIENIIALSSDTLLTPEQIAETAKIPEALEAIQETEFQVMRLSIILDGMNPTR